MLLPDEFRRLFLPMMTVAPSDEYLRAQQARVELAERWTTTFQDLELTAVLHPAAMDEPYRSDEEVSPEVMARLMFGTWSDTGFPVVSLPAGRSSTDGSPVGLQLVGLPFDDRALLQAAMDIQAASDYHIACPEGLDDEGQPYVGPRRLESGERANFVAPVNPFGILFPARRPGQY